MCQRAGHTGAPSLGWSSTHARKCHYRVLRTQGLGKLRISQHRTSFPLRLLRCHSATDGGHRGTGWELLGGGAEQKSQLLLPCPNAPRFSRGTGNGAGAAPLAPQLRRKDRSGDALSQAVLTLLLCFSPGPRHLQSGQSVPGTHDQHPVGADAHQSVHTLGH